MVVSFTPAGTVLTGAALDIRKTFDCGQCFRFAPDGGGYTGVAFGRVLHVTQDGGSIILHGVDRAAYEAVWADYFRPRARLRGPLRTPSAATGAAHGLRVFARHPHSRAGPVGDALLVHPVAEQQHPAHPQNHRVALRSGSARRLRARRSTPSPPPSGLPEVGMEGLAGDPLRLPRQYVADAAARVASARARPRSAAEAVLRSGQSGADDGLRRGRVADCVLLFSLGFYEAFPVDVGKVIAKYYGEGFDGRRFGAYAGVAQQYLFYYERSLSR